MKVKSLLFFLALLCALPSFARDFTYTYEGKTVSYTVIDEEAKTCKTRSGWYHVSGFSYVYNSGNYISGDLVLPEHPKDGDTEFTLTQIGSCGFADCSNLTSVIIPPSVTSVGTSAFENCRNIKKFAYPNTLEVPFSNGISYPAEGAIYENGIIYGVDKSGIYFAPLNLTGSFIVQESVKVIGNSAFYGCTGLTSVTIGESVTSIGSYAFYGCSGLTSVTLLGSEIPNIYNTAFSSSTYDTALLDIKGKTDDAAALLGSVYDTYWELFKNIKIGGFETKLHTDEGLVYHVINNPENPEAILVRGDYSNLTEANIPERFTDESDAANPVRYYVKAIAYAAFYNCTSLKTVNFNSRIKLNSINLYAFAGCTSLQTIKLPNTVTSIGKEAFRYCKDLTSIAIPNSVEYIGEDAFFDCTRLRKAEFASIESLCKIKFGGLAVASNPLALAKHLYIAGEEVKDVVIPASVTSIGDVAFANGESLTSITIPETVTSIGAGTFYNCKGLTSISIPASVSYIDQEAFGGCSGLTNAEFASIEQVCSIDFMSYNSNPLYLAHNLYIKGEEVKDVVIPGNIDVITATAFSGSNINSVIIPNSVTVIGEAAFGYTNNLKSVTFSDGNNPVKFYNDPFVQSKNLSKLYVGRDSFPAYFRGKSSLTEVIIGNTVKHVVDSAFQNCSNIKTLTLGSNLKTVGKSAFQSCSTLKDVVIPPMVDSIGVMAFAGISGLQSVTMGHSMKRIGEKAFDGATLKNVYITAQVPPTAPTNAFSNYTGTLWLQDAGNNKVIDAYYDALTCWDRFDGKAMVVATAIEGDGKKISGKPGETIKLSATVKPTNATLPQIFWRSTNPEVASVDANGVVTLNSAMTDDCKIIAETLYDGSLYAEWSVSVGNVTLVESISVEPTAWSGIVEEQKQLTVTVLPDDATDKSVTWASSNNAIATVDNTGLVKLVKEGNCTITVSTNDGSNLSAECIITSESGIDDIFADDNATYDVYNLNGILLHKDCDKDQLKQLTPGVYVIRSGNQAKTIMMR